MNAHYKLTMKIIHHLLEGGIYIHTTNSAGKTAMQLIEESDCLEFVKNDILKVLNNYDQSFTLKYMSVMKIKELNLSYENHLPVSMAKFVNLH